MTSASDINADQRLVKAATAARAKAYAPYSGFAVGAALIDENGDIHVGVNVENAAYPVGLCAEAAAIAAMATLGGRLIRQIAVSGDSGDKLCTPCGACRQRIREFADDDTLVIVCDATQLRQTFTLHELLPESFGPENL